MLSSPRKIKASSGSDAYVATKNVSASRDVGVAPTKVVPTKQVNDFHGNNYQLNIRTMNPIRAQGAL
jgi:hypothetical protein